MKAFLFCLLLGCGGSETIAKLPPSEPYDAVIIPGCPSEDDGSMTLCQMARAGHAAQVWHKGWARSFIVSGSAVHSPYVEAEAIAQAMTTLGVPADHIYLETNALHTDENVYYSMQMAHKLGLEHLAIAANGNSASWGCKMMVEWGHPCDAIPWDIDELGRFLPVTEAKRRLGPLRARKVDDWVDVDEREERIYADTGVARLPSWLLYPLLYVFGKAWVPPPVPDAKPVTWAARAGSGP